MSTNPKDIQDDAIDQSRYIRTYAKDMAALSGGVVPPARPTPAPAPTPPPSTQTTDGVTLAEVDESLITQSNTRKGEESLDLSDAATSGPSSVFERIDRTPPTPANVTQTSMAPSLDRERDAILARLKNRAPAAPPTPPAPVFVAPPEPVHPLPPIVKTPPAPAAAPAPFHSYTTDFSDRIDKKNASAFSVLASQADSAPRRPREVLATRTKKSSVPTIVLAATLVVLGGAAAVGAFMFANGRTQVPSVVLVPSLIPYDEKVRLEGDTGGALMRALADAANEPLVRGNVLLTYTASASTSPKGLLESPQPGGSLVKSLPLLAPDILLRNIRPESTVGIVHAGEETRPFFILRVASFERTFAGMLAWESTMRRSLSQLYPAYSTLLEPELPQTPQISGTTTVPFVAPLTAPEPTAFVDSVVRNYDVRVLRDGAGRSLMLYGYRDKETLIIARDESAFLELITRLTATGE